MAHTIAGQRKQLRRMGALLDRGNEEGAVIQRVEMEVKERR